MLLYVILLDVVALIVVLAATYITSKDADYAAAAMLPMFPLLLGMTMLATIVLGDSVGGTSVSRNIVDVSYVVVLTLWTAWIAWLFATHEKQPLGTAVDATSTDESGAVSTVKHKEMTLLDITVVGVMLAIVAVISGVVVVPVYQHPVINTTFIKGEASSIGTEVMKLSGGHTPSSREITRAVKSQKNSRLGYYDKVQSVQGSGTQTRYVVTNKLDASKACITITGRSFTVTGGTCA